MWWELKHQAGLGLTEEVIKNAATTRAKVTAALGQLAAAPYQDTADDDPDGPVLIIPGVTATPSTRDPRRRPRQPLKGTKFPVPSGKQALRGPAGGPRIARTRTSGTRLSTPRRGPAEAGGAGRE